MNIRISEHTKFDLYEMYKGVCIVWFTNKVNIRVLMQNCNTCLIHSGRQDNWKSDAVQFDPAGKGDSIHVTWHLDVRENQIYLLVGLEYTNCFVATACWYDAKATVLEKNVTLSRSTSSSSTTTIVSLLD